MAEPIIDVKNLQVIYNKGKSNEVRSLVDINVKIYPQEYIIMYGPSGCGKSTLLYSIAGLQLPTYGEVNVQGKNIATMKKKELVELHRTGIGMIFQAFYLIASLSILDNVCLPKVFRGENRKERKEDGMKLLRRFGLVEQSSKFPGQLSGGQQQRVSIARALINNPNIILADEPVGNLDSESAENVLKILKDLNEVDKKTIILVTHNPEHLAYADRVLYMKDGKIVSEEVIHDKRPKDVMKEEVTEEPEKISSELKLLMRTFKNFSPQQASSLLIPYKAKQLMAYLLSQLTEEQISSAENYLKDLLFKNINVEAFRKGLDLDFDEGGAGWNKLRAQSFSGRIGEMLSQAYAISEDYHAALLPFSEYLIKQFELKMNEEIKGRFSAFLRMRIENKIDVFGLQERLDASVTVGGAGLYKNTAERVVREVETVMLLKFTGL